LPVPGRMPRAVDGHAANLPAPCLSRKRPGIEAA
jgi:hypothetical protein